VNRRLDFPGLRSLEKKSTGLPALKKSQLTGSLSFFSIAWRFLSKNYGLAAW
jgi:hypothetical protein